ncbi:MAG TPA: alpha/beta family hydrolase [Egibacteraceae bacterium]|nr:alpha/beta family hydrolase [Egibacteraceae bacterium]
MCHEPDDHPPEAPAQGMLAGVQRRTLTASDGAECAATVATTRRQGAPGIVIVPDVRGLHPFYERLAEQYAQAGVHALAVDQYGRTAGAEWRGAGFAYGPLVADASATVHLDIAAAAQALREAGCERVFVTGFCFGGRAALMAAAAEGVDGVIGFYGWPVTAGVDGASPESLARERRLRAPVLALFGEADEGIPPGDVERYADALRASGVAHDVRVYADAPHSFFDRARTGHAGHCADAWGRALAFIETGHPA